MVVERNLYYQILQSVLVNSKNGPAAGSDLAIGAEVEMRKRLAWSVLAAGALLFGWAWRSPPAAEPGVATDGAREAQTGERSWEVLPSLKFDALCFLNALSGDPFYLNYYGEEYERFEPLLTPAAKDALAELKRVIKDDGGGIISAKLALYFSATSDSTLEDLARTTADPAEMRRALQDTPYYSEDGWSQFEEVRPALATVLDWLEAVGFEDYWRDEIRPIADDRIVEVRGELARYDALPEVERILGFALPSNRITVYMLYFNEPHGIRVTGTRFITAVTWPIRITVNVAIHEMLHPPYRLEAHPELRAALATLQQDTFLMARVENHDPSFGYNSFWGFVEEDIVQALDQLLSERFGVAPDPRQNWRESDDGMHVLAVAVYVIMRDERFLDAAEALTDFLIRQVRDGRLRPGRIRPLYEEFYAAER